MIQALVVFIDELSNAMHRVQSAFNRVLSSTLSGSAQKWFGHSFERVVVCSAGNAMIHSSSSYGLIEDLRARLLVVQWRLPAQVAAKYYVNKAFGAYLDTLLASYRSWLSPDQAQALESAVRKAAAQAVANSTARDAIIHADVQQWNLPSMPDPVQVEAYFRLLVKVFENQLPQIERALGQNKDYYFHETSISVPVVCSRMIDLALRAASVVAAHYRDMGHEEMRETLIAALGKPIGEVLFQTISSLYVTNLDPICAWLRGQSPCPIDMNRVPPHQRAEYRQQMVEALNIAFRLTMNDYNAPLPVAERMQKTVDGGIQRTQLRPEEYLQMFLNNHHLDIGKQIEAALGVVERVNQEADRMVESKSALAAMLRSPQLGQNIVHSHIRDTFELWDHAANYIVRTYGNHAIDQMDWSTLLSYLDEAFAMDKNPVRSAIIGRRSKDHVLWVYPQVVPAFLDIARVFANHRKAIDFLWKVSDPLDRLLNRMQKLAAKTVLTPNPAYQHWAKRLVDGFLALDENDRATFLAALATIMHYGWNAVLNERLKDITIAGPYIPTLSYVADLFESVNFKDLYTAIPAPKGATSWIVVPDSLRFTPSGTLLYNYDKASVALNALQFAVNEVMQAIYQSKDAAQQPMTSMQA